MAIKKFGVKKYASLEMNRAAYLKNGLIVSQTPLADTFTEEAPCENGMWLNANIANHEITVPAADAENVVMGICYTTEKEYGNRSWEGLKRFCSVGGEYPRVGIMQKDDHFTSNCFAYDDGDFEDDEALMNALKEGESLFLVPGDGDGRPVIATAAPAEGFYAQIVRPWTMPNGEPAVQYVIVRA